MAWTSSSQRVLCHVSFTEVNVCLSVCLPRLVVIKHFSSGNCQFPVSCWGCHLKAWLRSLGLSGKVSPTSTYATAGIALRHTRAQSILHHLKVTLKRTISIDLCYRLYNCTKIGQNMYINIFYSYMWLFCRCQWSPCSRRSQSLAVQTSAFRVRNSPLGMNVFSGFSVLYSSLMAEALRLMLRPVSFKDLETSKAECVPCRALTTSQFRC